MLWVYIVFSLSDFFKTDNIKFSVPIILKEQNSMHKEN